VAGDFEVDFMNNTPISLLLLTLIVAGCLTVGKPINRSEVDKIKKGAGIQSKIFVLKKGLEKWEGGGYSDRT